MRCGPAFLLLCACLRAQDAVSPPQSGIEGITIDAITRQPMAGVHVTMRAVVTHGLSPEDADTYGAVSRPAGHFSITGMTPGLYLLEAQHNGYVYFPPKTPGGRDDPTVLLKPGEPLKDFIVAMTPHAVIVGHVLDENGDPIQYVEVTAQPVQATRAMGGGGWAQTDERGQFRFALPPGRFYIQANANRGPFFAEAAYGPSEIRSDGLTQAIYGTVFYPDAASKDKATPVELGAGQGMTGIDIHLARRRSLTISGTITGIPATPPVDAFVTVALFSSGDSDSFSVKRESPVGADGKFAVPGVSPGRHRVLARFHSADGGNLQSPAVEIQLESADLTGVRLELLRGQTVSGTVEIEEGSVRKAPAEKLIVRLQSETGDGDHKGAEVDEKGAFHLDDVFPDKLRLRIMPLPENGYVKSVKFGTTEAPDGVLDFSHGVNGAHLNVIVSRNGGRIEGSVVGDDKGALRGLALVVLAASMDDIGEEQFKPVQPGERFIYAGLRPGKYRLFAIDMREFAGDQERLRGLFLAAPELEIHEGDRISNDINVTPVSNAKP